MKKKKAAKLSKPVSLRRGGETRTLPVADALDLLQRAFQARQFPVVIDTALQLLQQQGGIDHARLLLYRALGDTAQFQQLRDLATTHLTTHPRDLLSLEYGAHALRQLGADDEAIPLLERAVELAKTDAGLLNTLGTAYKERGDTHRALAFFRRATAIKPAFGQAYWNRSDLIPEAEATAEADVLEDQLGHLPATSKQRPYMHFALYRLREKNGDFAEAFDHLSRGNAAKKAQLGYLVETDLAIDRNVGEFFAEHFQELHQRAAAGSATFSDFAPIFIVGMPRSGTSLVEQIVASHSRVADGGELPLLTRATETLLRRLGATDPFPVCLEQFSAADFAQLGHVYHQLSTAYLKEKPRLTDKYLLNYKAVPLIRLTLPMAKIVHVERDAMDTCFGCYRQLFNSGLGFCYDLEDLAKTWRSYRQLMSTWRELTPDGFYSISYEALVNDVETEAKALLDYCELPWEEKCLSFHTAGRSVKTASSLQVREPIFTTGIGRWRRYERELTPLREMLGC